MRRPAKKRVWDAVAERTFVRRVLHLEETDSTNDEARRLLSIGDVSPPFLVVADRQTRGRGRRENRWWTGEGGLAMTLCVGRDLLGLPLETTVLDATRLLSLGTSLSVAEAASHTLVHREATVHWPNDVYVGERKLAGILIESTSKGHLVGIGVNTNNEAMAAPEELATRVTTLRDLCGTAIDSVEVAIEILCRFEENLRHAIQSVSFLVGEINRRCGQKGRSLTLRYGENTIVGTFVEISLEGDLILDTVNGRRTFQFGTVSSFRAQT